MFLFLTGRFVLFALFFFLVSFLLCAELVFEKVEVFPEYVNAPAALFNFLLSHLALVFLLIALEYVAQELQLLFTLFENRLYLFVKHNSVLRLVADQ